MAKNIHIVGNPVSDGGAYSGGSWAASLPLTNLINRHPKKFARSTSAASANTKFILDLQRLAPVSIFALLNHNLSVNATVRIRASVNSDLSSPLVDVTINRAVGQVVWGSLPWGGFPWDGVGADVQPGGQVTFYLAPAAVQVRYIGVDIVDTGNSAGYVQIGRFLADQPFVPATGVEWGAGLSFIDLSRHSRSDDGTLYSDIKSKYRRFTATLGWLTEGEGYGAIYNLQHMVGTTGGVLVIQDPDDAASVIERRMIYGTLAELAPLIAGTQVIDFPYSWTLAIEELI
jgi:hypothetical protein